LPPREPGRQHLSQQALVQDAGVNLDGQAAVVSSSSASRPSSSSLSGGEWSPDVAFAPEAGVYLCRDSGPCEASYFRELVFSEPSHGMSLHLWETNALHGP
jgi:hypothetical protein